MILEIQSARHREHGYVLRGLDAERTVTLADLLEAEAVLIKKKLACDWLNVDLLRTRICQAEASLLALKSKVLDWSKLALFFLQSSPIGEDDTELERRRKSKFLHGQWQELPAQAHYLRTNFWDRLEGCCGQWRVSPLMSFSAPGWGRFFKEICRNKGRVIGYRLPDYPQLLAVSPDVATELVARTLVHDLGHTVLPQIPSENESLHNVFMIHAARGRIHTEPFDQWDELVWAESCDPYFSVEGDLYLNSFDFKDLSKAQLALLNWFKKAYLPVASKRRQRLWGIQPGQSLVKRRMQVNKKLRELTEQDFAQYSQVLIRT
ncbi:hypothetical protein KC644_01420 [Candidatus Berkelbacteria bacterium]|nr:hypothetical protein [Candidatus Berkelbacteria bacterium]MCB1113522.1 hypothetical protein [Chlamydiia bacterium]